MDAATSSPVAAQAIAGAGPALDGAGARGDQHPPAGSRADATHLVYANSGAGYTAERLLCDGNWETRQDFTSSLAAYAWATAPAPGTVNEGSTQVIAVDDVQAGVITALADEARAKYEQIVEIVAAQKRPQAVADARHVLARMSRFEEAL